MGCVVTFNYRRWIARYPLFACISETTAQEYFNEATLYQRNDGTGPIGNPERQLMLLNMMTAHIAALNNPQAGASGLVGRVSSATEGSVTVQTENNYPPGTAQWFQQTQFGSSWWTATAQYRRARYVPGRAPRLGIYPVV